MSNVNRNIVISFQQNLYENGITYFFSAPSFFTERLDVFIYYDICKLFIKPKKKGILG